MAPNQVGKNKRKYKNCPTAILNVVPKEFSKITFSELVPGENYENTAIIGKMCHLYPLGMRADGETRKILITDALDDSVDNEKQMPVYLFGQFAKDSESFDNECYIVISNFIVQHVKNKKTTDMPVQVLVKRNGSQVWFGRKVNRPAKKRSVVASSRLKKLVVSDGEESHAVSVIHYEYTKLRDLVASESYYNVYGIVDKCDLKISQGTKVQFLDLLLTDETDANFSCFVFAGEGEIFPDVYPGDIVRVHRMQVSKFRNKLRGKCNNPKFLLVFGKDNDGDKPRTVAKTFTFEEDDVYRAQQLLHWNKTRNTPKLICDIQKDDFVNIVCQVIGVYVAKIDAVILKIWDGTKTNEFPGVHLGLKEEKLDQKLFTVARNYYVNLFVYGHHIGPAAELEPGKYIEVRDAHLYTNSDNPEEAKLTIHSGNKEGRGISVLTEDDERVVSLKKRLEKIISDTLEFGSQTDDLLSQNNSIFLNYDISIFNSQPPVNGGNIGGHAELVANEEIHTEVGANEEIHTEIGANEEIPAEIRTNEGIPVEVRANEENPAEILANEEISAEIGANEKVPPEIGANEEISAEIRENQEIPSEIGAYEEITDENRTNERISKDLDLLNEPMNQLNTSPEKTVLSVVDASIKPGQSTQEFGAGMQTVESSAPDDENRISVTSEPDPICNLTPLQTRYFFHDPQRASNQMTDSIFPTYTNNSEDKEWWNSVPTVSVTDQHSDVTPTRLDKVVQHDVPWRFRVIAAAFCFKPNTSSIDKFIKLCCPNCDFISEVISSLEPYQERDGLFYFHCPVCKCKTADRKQWPVLEYSFMLSLLLHDGSSCIEAYLWKENAVKFFKGITPEESLRDSALADSILHMLWNICPNCRPFNASVMEHSSVYPMLDCCIYSYTSENDTRYQMFDTILI